MNRKPHYPETTAVLAAPGARWPQPPAPVNLPDPDAALDRAGRVAFYHGLACSAARVSVMAAIAAGVELIRAKAEAEHGMFQSWVEKNCEFGRSTAYKYMSLAEGVLGDRLPALVEANSRAPAVALIEAHASDTEARSLTELYADMGIVRRTAGLGGRRPGAGRPRAAENLTPDEIEARARADATQAANDVANLLELICRQEMWRGLARADARIFVKLVRDKVAIIAAGIENL
jgi:predicted DNA-binding protein (UPF0251 family)